MRLFAGEALSIPFGLAVAMVLARSLGPASLGVFALACAMAMALEWMLNAFFGRSTLKLAGENPGSWRCVASVSLEQTLLLTGGSAVLLFAASEPLARHFHEPALTWPLRLLATYVPLVCAASVHQRILTATGRNTARAWASVIRWPLRLALTVAFVIGAGWGPTGAVAAMIGAEVAHLALLMGLAPITPIARQPEANAFRRAIWALAGSMIVISAGQVLYDRVEIYLLKMLGGSTAQVGLFSAAKSLLTPAMLLSVVASAVLIAELSKASSRGDRNLAAGVIRALNRSSLLALPLAILGAFAAGPVATLLLGPEYAPAQTAVGILVVGCLGFIVSAVAISVLIAENRIPAAIVLSLSMAFLEILLALWWIPLAPLEGAAAAKTVSALLSGVAALILLNRNLRPLSVTLQPEAPL